MEQSNIDQFPSNSHLSDQKSQLYIFEENEAVIKMIIKGRSPTRRHASRTHRVSLDWLFDRINFDAKVQIKYVESKNQLAEILTKGVFRVMSGTTCCISLISWTTQILVATFTAILFFPQERKIWNVEKISGKLFILFANGESESMLSRFATMRICGTRWFE